MKARDVMTRPVTCFPVDTPVSVAAELLTSNGFAAAPVVDEDGKPVGIVTAAGLSACAVSIPPRQRTRRAARRAVPVVVRDVMTSQVESMTPGADVGDVVRMMLDERIEWVSIVDGRSVVGVITPQDLFRAAHPETPSAHS